MATEKLWTGFDNTKIMAERAVCDEVGQNIVDTYATKDPMVGATSQEAGEAGLVPAPAAGDQGKVLTGDGTWSEVEEYTDEYIDSLFAGNVVVIGGRSYPYVQIGNQLWLAENLDYKFEVGGRQIPIGVSKTPSTPSAWYYNNEEKTYGVNGNKYGLLYNWHAVKYLEDNKSTLLPEGWHVPTTEEWDTLMNAVGGNSIAGTKLKSITGWDSGNGDDSYGFTAFPSGFYYGSFDYLGSNAGFWTSIEYNSSNAYYRGLGAGTSLNSGNDYKTFGYSVRLVKDS